MEAKTVHTVLGPVAPESLGVTYPHEHLSMNYGPSFVTPPPEEEANVKKPLEMQHLGWVRQYPYSSDPNLYLREEEDAVTDEMHTFKAAGGGTVVENSIIGLERNMDFLERVSKETGVNIIAGTGYYLDSFQKPDALALTEEQMADRITLDLTQGWEGKGPRCGVIGEVGCSWPLTDWEKSSLRASAGVQRALGCPVIIHPGRHRNAPGEIMRLLLEAGGDASHTIMSHLDRTLVEDADLLEFARHGCINEFDLFGIECSWYQMAPEVDMLSDGQRVRAICSLIQEGYADNIVISHDIHTKHRLTKYGGHGYSHILKNVLPKMRIRGITQEQIDQILIHTPRRWLTWK